MKHHLLPALKLTGICLLVLLIAYPALIFLIGQIAPANGKGETIERKGIVVGYKLEGQRFDSDSFFWSRPSAVSYNAASSAGSNKSTSNPDYIKQQKDWLDSFLAKHTYIKTADVPAEMITASGSGLDPDISPRAAMIQVKRVAEVRGINETKLERLVLDNTQKPMLGIFGPAKVNVLKLNIDLENL